MAEQPSESKGSTRFEDIGKKVDERFNRAAPKVEDELKKLIAYLNDQVVPQLRQDSAQALRVAADGLRKLAEQVDDSLSAGAR